MAYAVLKDKHFCKYCGWVDREYDENAPAMHEATAKHNCNRILYEYKLYKSKFSKNRDGLCVFVSAVAIESQKIYERTSNAKIIVHVKPQESAKFYFHISNELKSEDVLILGIQLAHPQPHFIMNKHPYVFSEEPRYLHKKSSIMDEVSVTFRASDIGQYEMPIMITFHTRSANRDIIFIREMVVMVDEFAVKHPYVKNPYTDESYSQTENFLSGLDDKEEESYKIPKLLKIVLPKGLGDEVIDSLPKTMDEDQKNQISEVVTATRAIFDEGLTVNNYMNYFHHLLWWEEIIARINIRVNVNPHYRSILSIAHQQ